MIESSWFSGPPGLHKSLLSNLMTWVTPYSWKGQAVVVTEQKHLWILRMFVNTPQSPNFKGSLSHFPIPSKVGLSQWHLLLREVQVPWPSKLHLSPRRSYFELASGRPVSRWKHHPNLKTNRLIRISQLHWVHSLLVLTWTEVQQAFWKRCLGLQEWQSTHRGLCAKGGWVWIH